MHNLFRLVSLVSASPSRVQDTTTPSPPKQAAQQRLTRLELPHRVVQISQTRFHIGQPPHGSPNPWRDPLPPLLVRTDQRANRHTLRKLASESAQRPRREWSSVLQTSEVNFSSIVRRLNPSPCAARLRHNIRPPTPEHLLRRPQAVRERRKHPRRLMLPFSLGLSWIRPPCCGRVVGGRVARLLLPGFPEPWDGGALVEVRRATLVRGATVKLGAGPLSSPQWVQRLPLSHKLRGERGGKDEHCLT